VITKTVKASGGDYTSLVTWEATEQTSLSDDHTVECYKGTYGGGGLNYLQENLTIAGWTLNGYTVTVKTPSTERHTGIPLSGGNYTGFCIRNASAANPVSVINISQENTHIEGLIVANTMSINYSDTVAAIYANGNFGGTHIHENIALAQNVAGECGTAFYIRSPYGGYTKHCHNNLACASDNGSSYGWASGYYFYNDIIAYNNTAANCTTPYTGTNGSGGGLPLVVNNIAQRQGTSSSGFSGSFHASSNYNLSDDATAPGANSVLSTTLTFNNASGLDFNLNASDTSAHTAGIGPSSDANVPSTDIIGTARSGATCSFGAFEYVAAGVTGSVNRTLSNITSAASGGIYGAGTLAKTLGNITLSASGNVGSGITGSLAETLANISSAAAGVVSTIGSLAKTLADITSTIAGTISTIGTISKTLDNITSAGAGTITTSGSVGVTLDNITVAATGFNQDITGSLNLTMDDVSCGANGYVGVQALPPGTLELLGVGR
jgi:hypothetical protein